MKIRLLGFALFAWACVATSSAHDGCEGGMEREITVIGSGRNADVLHRYEEAFQFLFGPAGLLERFELKLSPQVARVVAGREMDLLASQGRHAVGHWSEGAEIVRQVNSHSGVIYEFVASQSDACQVSYYRDTLEWGQQISIIMHVVGHDLFATHSKFAQKRENNSVGRSLQLYALMETLYRNHNREEVSGWYDFLTMLSYFQDMSRGTHESPEAFAPGEGKKIPRNPTANVLQALVANLPPNTPSWKREMAVQFEAIHRHYSGSAPTKIMNEGFATLMQELLPAHSPYSDLTHLFGWSDLSSGVVRGDYSNPYKLGLEAWRRVRARFNERKENQGLSRFELDKRFLHYALEDVIGIYDDYSFLEFALDVVWARESGLALTRQLSEEQWKEIPPPPPGAFETPAQKQVVSRDRDRIVRMLQRAVADLRSKMPRMILRDLYYEHRTILLGFEDEFGSSIPLEPRGMISTLFMIARHMERNVALDTVLMPSPPADDAILYGPRENTPTAPTPPALVRIEVSPAGNVSVVSLPEANSMADVAAELQQMLKDFREYQDIGVVNPLAKLWKQETSFEAAVSETAATLANAVPPSLMMAAPTAARAVAEYHAVLSARLSAIMRLAMQGKAPMKRGPGGVQVDVLPVIPSLQFDREAFGQLMSPPDSNDVRKSWVQSQSNTGWKSPARPDDANDLENTDGDEGGIYWGNGSPPPGQGGAEGNKPANGSRKPTAVNIPHELFAKMLSTLVELPNLNPKRGPSTAWTSKRHGATQGKHGQLAQDRILENAYPVGRAKLLERGETEKAKIPRECILEGLKNLRDEDWRIVSRAPDVRPDISAQMTFVVDASASMGDFKETVKQIVYDLQTILSRKYQRMEFRFVMFDGESIVYKTLGEFLKAWKGGGTDYEKGFETALHLQDDFPREQWDRYVTIVGDLEDFGGSEGALARARKLVDQSEFVGTMFTTLNASPEPTYPLGQTLKQWADQNKFVGFASVLGPDGYYPLLLRKLFKNPDLQ